MPKVKLKNGKIIEVTNNVAHGMIERGEAKLFVYKDKQMRPKKKTKKKKKGYRVK